MSTLPAPERVEPDRVRNRSLAVGVIALLVCVVGGFFSPEQFFRSYLAAYLFYQGIALGCMVVLMIYYVTGGAWGFLVRRILEAGTRTLPLLALLFLPIGFGLTYLFIWARPEEVAADPDLQWKHVYLNVPFWWGRAVLFFAAWLILTYFLNLWSRRQDESGDARFGRKLETLSGPGLVIYALCIHFACVDWIMSLQPAFRSTIFGPIMGVGHILSALALVIVVLGRPAARAALGDFVSVEALTDLGSLLFTLLVIWAYLLFFQFMLIWIADLPFEVIWYLDRSRGGWQWVVWALFILHFAVPFFLLLQRRVKRNPAVLAAVAGLILFMQLVFVDYQILPAFRTVSLAQHWMDFVMPVGLGGIWLACFLWQLNRRPLVSRHDPNRKHAIDLVRGDQEAAAREVAINHG